jgi:organic radical activating enzyme
MVALTLDDGTDKVLISQIFGPTFQGEGTAAGQHCLFIRTYGCNLHCTWCDTAYTWADTDYKAALTESGRKYSKFDPKLGAKEMTHSQILDELRKLWDIDYRPTMIVISGGEPMMQQDKLVGVMSLLTHRGHQIHVETAGTFGPTFGFDAQVTQYNVSPKLQHSGNRLLQRYRPNALSELLSTGKARFKFVVRESADLPEVDSIVKSAGISPSNVMIMPEGTTQEKLAASGRDLADQILKRGYSMSMRLHVALWGDDVDK